MLKKMFKGMIVFVFLGLFFIVQSSFAAVIFRDTFDSAIDPMNWQSENIDGGSWIYQQENGNGFAHSYPLIWCDDNRYLDMLTQRDDFSDFLMTVDMRFINGGNNQDWRKIYFRGDYSYNVYGYYLVLGLNVASTNSYYVSISRIDRTGSFKQFINSRDYSWDLNRWYTFKLSVLGNEFKAKWWLKGTQEPNTWFLEAVDEENMFTHGNVGFGNYWFAVTDVDNVTICDSGPCPSVPEPVSGLMFLIGINAFSVFRRRC